MYLTNRYGINVAQACGEVFKEITHQPLFTECTIHSVPMRVEDSAESFLRESLDSRNDIPSFTLRSRSKCSLRGIGPDHIAVKNGRKIRIISEGKLLTADYSKTALKNYILYHTNKHGAIFVNENRVAILSFQHGVAKEYEFRWNPYRTSVSDKMFFIGTRKTPEGPGELYCFSSDADIRWAIRFNKKITEMGMFSGDYHYLQPYFIHVRTDRSGIVAIQDLDSLLVFNEDDLKGFYLSLRVFRKHETNKEKAKTRTSLSDLISKSRSEDEKIKHISETYGRLSSIELGEAILPEPGVVNVLHNTTDNSIYILDTDSRLTAWKADGDLFLYKHLHSFIENDEPVYFGKSGPRLIVSYKSGLVYWLDLSGTVTQTAKMEKGILDVFRIDDNSAVAVGADGWLHYVDESTGDSQRAVPLRKQATLYSSLNQFVLIDEYLWLSSKERFAACVSSYEKKPIVSQKARIEVSKVVSYINPTQSGNLLYAKVDGFSQSIYVARYEDEQPALIAYDYSLRTKWTHEFPQDSVLLGLSLGSKDSVIAVTLGECDPIPNRRALIYSINGSFLQEIEGISISSELIFHNRNRDIHPYNQGVGVFIPDVLIEDEGRWRIVSNDTRRKRGMRIQDVLVGQTRVMEVGNKEYKIFSDGKYAQICTKAAIYGIMPFPNNEERILLLIGTKTFWCIDTSGEIKWEINLKEKVHSIMTSGTGIVCASDMGLFEMDSFGSRKWDHSVPFADRYSSIGWNCDKKCTVWAVGNDSDISLIVLYDDGSIAFEEDYVGRSGVSFSNDCNYCLIKSSNRDMNPESCT